MNWLAQVPSAFREYVSEYEAFHSQVTFQAEPEGLYEPIRYIMRLGGKRIRPLLFLMACDAVGGRWREHLSQAYALELFHNFTLVHDDIMDGASLRRGKPTVHEKFGLNAGILSGDAMVFYCQIFLTEGLASVLLPRSIALFNQTAIRIIEGQQMDMDFENQGEVKADEYLKMIEYKTSVLLGCALQLGALTGGAAAETEEALYQAGIRLGLAFQIRDDILDAFGDERFGKVRGGDIIQNKKTLLYILASENASPDDRKILSELRQESDLKKKVQETLEIFERSGALKMAQDKAESLYQQAVSMIHQADITDTGRARLLELFRLVHERNI
ncbi:MAG: polyprenyl synthetase family protein [Flavobacteriales bacterium]|nr:polyprenyl synthetase family protein [Flavobacteriales bacterium]